MYVPLMIVGLVLVSFFSVGIPEFSLHELVYPTRERGVLFHNPIPLSFPLYATVTLYRGELENMEFYRVYVFIFVIQEEWHWWYGLKRLRLLHLSWFDYVLYYSFFMLVNMVGAIVGYWLSKATFMEKLLKKRTNQ